MRVWWLLALALIAIPAAAQVPPGFELDGDKFNPILNLLGPSIALKGDHSEIGRFYLRSLVEKRTRAVVHQVHVWQIYDDSSRRGYFQAYDDHAGLHPVVVFRRETLSRGRGQFSGDNSYSEAVGIEISDEQIRAYAQTGVAFKLIGPHGDSVIIEIPKVLIQEQLAALGPYVNKPYEVDPRILPPLPLGAGYSGHAGFGGSAPQEGGMRVTRVETGSVAEAAGLQKGDWILDLNGQALKSEAEMKAALARLAFGDSVAATVRRRDDTLRVTLKF